MNNNVSDLKKRGKKSRINLFLLLTRTTKLISKENTPDVIKL